MQHLITKGCKNIIHFSSPKGLEIYKNRFKGYKEALKKNGISFRSEYIISSRSMELDGATNAQKLLNNNVTFDAIFSAYDVAAIGAIKYLIDEGINIPEDIAIVGFSNGTISTVINPTLTTINQPGFEIGTTTDLLFKNIKNENGLLNKR